MNSKKWIQKALSACLAVAVMTTGSMITLASSEKITGELLVSEASSVTVNGEAAQNGRSIFSSSTIATPKNSGAVVNIGKIGKIELAPDTNLILSFNEKGIEGSLSAGRITVLNASENVSIKTVDGTTANLASGESVTANGAAQDDDAVSDGGSGWIIWAAVLGGAAVGIVLAATTDNNRTTLGSSANVLSPTR